MPSAAWLATSLSARIARVIVCAPEFEEEESKINLSLMAYFIHIGKEKGMAGQLRAFYSA
jgi:hypothetical protein